MYRVVSVTREILLAEQTLLATSFVERLRGLLGRRGWEGLDGLWLEPCLGVHSIGMRFEVEVVTMDATMRVLHVQTLPPLRLGRVHLDGAAALEVPRGTLARTGTRPGDILCLEPEDSTP